MSFNPQRSPRRQRTATTANALFFVVGVFVGFLASSFLSMVSYEPLSVPKERVPVSSASMLSSQTQAAKQQTSPRTMEYKDSSDNADGWSLIHVYYGNASHLADTSTIPKDYFLQAKWFSQVQQDLVVSTLLHHKRNGYFVDLAANDAVRISNTYALETNFGWQGLCLEPNPIYWPSLSYRKCHTVGAVVGAEAMRQVQFKYPNRAGPKGGIVGKDFDNKQASKFGEDRPRFTVTLLEIFERFETPSTIDYLSLDIEGAEDYVMESFPFDRYRINVLTVERPSDKLRLLLERHDYILLKQLKNWGETVWVHRQVESSLDTKSALAIDTENYKYRERSIATTK